MDMNDIVEVCREMSDIAAEIARDAEVPAKTRVSAAAAAGRIAVTAAPVIRLQVEMERDALTRANDIIDATPYRQGTPAYQIERVRAERFLTDRTEKLTLVDQAIPEW